MATWYVHTTARDGGVRLAGRLDAYNPNLAYNPESKQHPLSAGAVVAEVLL